MYSLSSLDGIVFDMDGVIFDTERLGIICWKRVADRYGFEGIEEFALKCIGRSTKDTMAMLRERYGEDIDLEKLHGETREVMNGLIEENHGMPLKTGAGELLQWLKEKNVRVGLASSTREEVVKAQLTMAGLIDYFQVIVGGDMIENSKPQPDIYLLACERLGVRPENTLAVEDSKNGIISASRAGMIPVLVPDLIKPDEQMLTLAYVKLNTLEELRERLSNAGL